MRIEADSKQKWNLRRLMAWFHGENAKCAALFLLGGLLLYGLFALACMSTRYSIQEGDVASRTITATKDVEDRVTTEQRRDEAASKVEPSYRLKEGTNEAVLMSLDKLLGELALVQQYGQNLRSTAQIAIRTYSGDEIAYAQALVNGLLLNPYQIRVLLNTPTDSFNTMVSEVRTSVENALNTTIREEQKEACISSILNVLKYQVDSDLTNSIVPIVLRAVIEPNMVRDEEATENAQQAARAAVSPVIYKQGQNIVIGGEKVTSSQIRMLNELGLLDTARIDLTVYGGAALIVAFSLLLLVLLLHMLSPETLHAPRQIIVIMLVMVINVGLGVICVKLLNVHLVPVALGAMLLTGLLGDRIGLSAGISLAVLLASLSAGSDSAYSEVMVPLMLTGITGSVVAVRFLAGKPQRVRTVICGVLVAGVNIALMLAQGLMTAPNLTKSMSDAVWSMAGGVLSGLIAVGFQPVFEAAFNLATPSKLLELANPNQPLLRRLLLEAPGTYHHAIIVANLAEAAAERIGANPLLARTGAYFHDIGKLKRPLYFKENQRGDNPHDRTDPYMSANIVTSHTGDGLVLAQKYHLPPEIQRIIVEHHGDTPVMYFYHKALQQADGKPVDIKDFRYSGNRPSTKESAIVMLADTIEAAVRSMPDPTPQAIQRFIERLVRGKIEDGQLSNSPLSLLDIDGICEAFSAVLSGVFHERIEYPNVQPPAESRTVPVPKPAPSPVNQSAAPAPVTPHSFSMPLMLIPGSAVKPEQQPVTPVQGAEQPVKEAAADIPEAVRPADEPEAAADKEGHAE